MADNLVRGFRTQLNTALESTLRRAVCEIMSIFESSLHDHQMELAHKGEEVAHLKIKLQTAEIKLKEYEVGGDREVEINETQTNRSEINQREPEAVVNPYGQTADVPEIDIEVPDDWCAPLGDETTTKQYDVCPSVRLRQLLIPLCRIPVIKQEVVNHATDPSQQEHVRRSVRGSSSEKHTQTIILPVYNQETQPKSQTSHKKKLPQGLKQDNHDKTASVGVRRGRRQLKEKEQTCTVTSSREERKNTTETTEQETVGNGKRIYTCKLCSKVFNTDYGQRVHARSHMCCRGCRKVFPFPRDMKSHKRYCKKLKKVLAKESWRRKNEKLLLTTEKDGDNKMYSCPSCMKKSSSKGKLLHHIRSHTIEKPFACSVCQKKFHVNDVLQKHMRKHQDIMKPAETNGDLAWTMPLEDAEGDSISPSKDSSSAVSSNNVKKGPSQGWKTMGVQTTEGYTCLKCKKLISNKWLLIEHYRLHTGERPIKCKGCPEKFRSCQQLYLHKKKCSYYMTIAQSAKGQP